jgi:hypothetical protein
MSTNDEKKSPGPPQKPPVREVKGERQKAKGESGEVKGERSKAKGKSATQNAESKKPAPAPVVSNAESPVEQPVPKPIQKSDPDSYREENPKSDINTMEVHHHPQLDHSPKPIKEYLLEGFMIFIAVMMGFIAENIREYIDNNEQVKHLTSQLVQDLRADTAQLQSHRLDEDSILMYNDTLLTLLRQPLAKADTRRIQKMAARSHSMWLFHPSAGAIAAIKNQLHLKQFSNSDIIGYFDTYERHIELVHTDQDVNLQYQRTYLDPFLTAHLTPENMVAAFGRSLPTTEVRNLTQADLDQLATDMVLIRLITTEIIADNKQLKVDAVSLLNYVKKQYSIED